MNQPEIPFLEKLRDEVARTASQQTLDVPVLAAAPRQASGPMRGRHRWPWLTAAGMALCAAVIVAIVLITAGASPPPAYALTQHSDGSITVTIRNIDVAIPQLNARFRHMGINETVLPVRPNCEAAQYFGYPSVAASQTLTFDPGNQSLKPGWDGVIAAERLPSGRIAMSIGARKPPLPACVHAVVLNLNALRHAARSRTHASH